MGDLFGVGGAKVDAVNPLEDMDSEEEEDREEEIKQLLANALCNETFEEESDTSFVERDERSIHSNNTSQHSFRLSLSNGKKNGVSPLNNSIHARNRTVTDGFGRRGSNGHGGGGDQGPERDKGADEMVAKNETVSLLHETHCPKTTGGEGGDGSWLRSELQQMEQLRTLCEFRERQVVRAEETIEGLAKDKRALNHSLGLLRTEMVQLKTSEEETQNMLKLKEEETQFVKSQLAQLMDEVERARKSERETKERNVQLAANIGKLEQEIDMLSAIGSSAQQAELDDVVRQIREKQAKEILSWKGVVKELEAQIRGFQRVDERENEWKRRRTCETQTEARQAWMSSETQTDPQSPTIQERQADWDKEKARLVEMYENELELSYKKLEEISGQLRTVAQQCQVLTKPKEMRENWTMTEPTKSQPHPPMSVETQTSPEPRRRSSTNTESGTNLAEDSVSVESQTDETLETYRILARLIEQWVAEVEECTGRAERAETRAERSEREATVVKRKLAQLLRVLTACRIEWKGRERSLERRAAETKAHYIQLLASLHAQVERIQTDVNSASATPSM